MLIKDNATDYKLVHQHFLFILDHPDLEAGKSSPLRIHALTKSQSH